MWKVWPGMSTYWNAHAKVQSRFLWFSSQKTVLDFLSFTGGMDHTVWWDGWKKVIEGDMSHVKSYAWEIEMAQFQNGSKSRSRVFQLFWPISVFIIEKVSHLSETSDRNFSNLDFSCIWYAAYDFTWDMTPSMTFWAILRQRVEFSTVSIKFCPTMQKVGRTCAEIICRISFRKSD